MNFSNDILLVLLLSMFGTNADTNFNTNTNFLLLLLLALYNNGGTSCNCGQNTCPGRLF